MSTLDISCGRCSKTFRVRAEFAGRATRCPGCSAPLTVGGAAPAPPKSSPEPDRPRRQPRLRDDDDEPKRQRQNWNAADRAFARERIAAVFVCLQMGISVVSFCIMSEMDGPLGSHEAGPLVILLNVLPLLGTVFFSFSARIAAIGAPAGSSARTSAWASVICVVAAMGSLLFLGIASLKAVGSIGSNGGSVVLAIAGVLLSGLFALATFCGFIAQVGIETRGKEINRAIGRTAIGTAITVAVVLALAGILAFGQLIVNPGYSRDQERVANIVVGVLVPISALVIMMMYQSLLGAGRRSLANRVADRD